MPSYCHRCCICLAANPLYPCRHWLQGHCSCLRGHLHCQQRLPLLLRPAPRGLRSALAGAGLSPLGGGAGAAHGGVGSTQGARCGILNCKQQRSKIVLLWLCRVPAACYMLRCMSLSSKAFFAGSGVFSSATVQCCAAAGTCLPPGLLHEFTTRIWMRLRPSKTGSSSSGGSSSRADLAQQLAQLDPLMLLNLRKLRWARWCCSLHACTHAVVGCNFLNCM
jgi:hypothetical protein